MGGDIKSSWNQVFVTLVISLVTGGVWLIYSDLDNKRKDELEYVRGQIAELYGPMYTLSSATENVWNNLDKAYKPETISDDDIKKWPSEIMNVIEPLNGLMEKTFLSSKQFIRCDATREALESLVVFAETEKLQSSTGKDDPGHALGFLKSPYPRHLSEQLRDELSALRDREKRLENGIFGLVTWGTLPECKTPPTSDQTAKNEG